MCVDAYWLLLSDQRFMGTMLAVAWVWVIIVYTDHRRGVMGQQNTCSCKTGLATFTYIVHVCVNRKSISRAFSYGTVYSH